MMVGTVQQQAYFVACRRSVGRAVHRRLPLFVGQFVLSLVDRVGVRPRRFVVSWVALSRRGHSPSLARSRRRSPTTTLARRCSVGRDVGRRPSLFVGSFGSFSPAVARSIALSLSLTLRAPWATLCVARDHLSASRAVDRRSPAIALCRFVRLLVRSLIFCSQGTLLAPPPQSLGRYGVVARPRRSVVSWAALGRGRRSPSLGLSRRPPSLFVGWFARSIARTSIARSLNSFVGSTRSIVWSIAPSLDLVAPCSGSI